MKMKKFTLICILLVSFILSTHLYAQLPHAQVRGGYYTDAEEFFLGAGLNVSLLVFSVVPNFEYLILDTGDWYTINLDGQYDILPLPGIGGYVGAGAGYHFIKPEGFDTESKFAVNILAGVRAKLIPLKPFLQAKYVIISDVDNQFVVMVGINL
jgi:hypothetical protein